MAECPDCTTVPCVRHRVTTSSAVAEPETLRSRVEALIEKMRLIERVAARSVGDHPTSDRTQADARMNTYAGAWADELAAIAQANEVAAKLFIDAQGWPQPTEDR